MNSLAITRHWLAKLTLHLEDRDHKTALITNTHIGPLRVQRPFYPERHLYSHNSDCCHLYLLHPPGGMVLGDELQLQVIIAPKANALITTPSAGKVYGVQNSEQQQCQTIDLCVEDGACLEWLPQETIVFNGANGRLSTRLDLKQSAKACVWDIVCLGRPAAQERFIQGRCDQTLEVRHNGKLLLLERNRFEGGAALLSQAWGLHGGNTSGTLCATVNPTRDFVDALISRLNDLSSNTSHASQWGLTQKNNLFIARYIGDSASFCRKGFELIWRAIRPLLNQREAVVPRIWNT